MSYQPCEDSRAMITKILSILPSRFRAILPQGRSKWAFHSQLEFRF
jgi:hypothetical protein